MSVRCQFGARVVMIGVLALSCAAALAQVAAPPPLRSDVATGISVVIAGRVIQLLMNPNGDVDGLLLEDGMQVQFPPHLSAAVLKLVSVGDVISVQGFRAGNVPVVHAMLITNKTDNASVADRPPDPRAEPPAPPPLTALNANGNIVSLLYTDRGDLNGFVLTDKTIVHFPPHVGAQLQAAVRVGQPVSASGYGTQNRIGRSLEATALAVNGETPMAIYGPRRPR